MHYVALGGRSIPLIRRGEIGMSVEQLPVAVDASVDVSESNHHLSPRTAIDADVGALEADRVGDVSAGRDDGVLHAHAISAGEAAADPLHGVDDGCVSLLNGSPRPERVMSSEAAQELILGPGSPFCIAVVMAVSCSSAL